MFANIMSSNVSSASKDKSVFYSESETEAELKTDFSLSKNENGTGESTFNVGNISVNETGRGQQEHFYTLQELIDETNSDKKKSGKENIGKRSCFSKWVHIWKKCIISWSDSKHGSSVTDHCNTKDLSQSLCGSTQAPKY